MWLVEETRKNLPKELDFMHEARNADRVRRMFSHLSFLKVGHASRKSGQPVGLRTRDGHVLQSYLFLVLSGKKMTLIVIKARREAQLTKILHVLSCFASNRQIIPCLPFSKFSCGFKFQRSFEFYHLCAEKSSEPWSRS